MQKNRGFTLIELMVTIAVLAIIATMAVPAYQDMMVAQNFNKSTQDFISTLSQARAKAVLERRMVKVQLQATSALPSVADTADQLNWKPNGSVILKNGSPVELVFGLTGGVFIKDPSDASKWIPAAADTTFSICNKTTGNNKKSKVVGVSRMGTLQQVTEGTCS